MNIEEDHQEQEKRIAKLSNRKQEKFRKGIEIQHKILGLQSQVRELEQEWLDATKGLSRHECIMVDRHALLESLLNDQEPSK